MILVLCLCERVAFAQASDAEFAPTDSPGMVDLLPSSFAPSDSILGEFNRPSNQTFALELGPKLVELKATYWEKRREESLSIDSLSDSDSTKWGRYFNLLAASSWFEGKLVGESELAYSAPGFASFKDQLPIMRRLGVKGRWGKAGYGLSHRAFGQGFLSLAGAEVEHDRDESQLWGEYNFGLLRLRGAAGETREENSVTHELTLTKTAAASFHLAKPNWSALFSSSYSSIGRGEDWNDKTFAFANGLALVYRPVTLFSVAPNFSFRHQWDPSTRLKTDTPSAGLALAYQPFRDLQLIGRASYARDLSDDPLEDASLVSTAAGLKWKLGKSFIGEHSVSLGLEYKNESRPTLPENQQANLIGTVQFRIVGF
jgi:hypothetical protein